MLTSGVFGSPFHVDFKKGYKLLTDPGLFAPVNKMPVKDVKKTGTVLQRPIQIRKEVKDRPARTPNVVFAVGPRYQMPN